MPADDGFRLHDQERRAPVGPHFREPHPEDAVTLAKLRALSRMLQDGELLTDGDNLRGEFCPVTEERPNQGAETLPWIRPSNLSFWLTTYS